MRKYKLSDNTWDDKELKAIKRVIASKQFTMGAEVKEFEKRFAAYFGSRYAIMVNSGSSANLLAIAALFYSGKLKKGDEVIVPAVSWSTTFYPISQYGLKLRFVDIDRVTLNIDLDIIEAAITENTRAIFAVNLLGNPNDYDKLKIICSKHNLLLIEDNCEALGAKYKGKYCGTFGLLGTFSTFFSHHICTMEGGVVATDDEELYHYMLAIRAHGWTRNLPKNSKLYMKSEDPFYEYFNFIIPGYNLRPLEIEAAVGLEQIKKIDKIISNRRKNAKMFQNMLNSNPNILIQKEIGESSWFGFSLVLINELEGKRDLVVNKLEDNGVEVRPIVAGNFTRNKVIEYMDYSIFGELKDADYIHENGFFIGNHADLVNRKTFENIREIIIV
jgi:CDP-6-deoxy-D-xylo-4-hexulose-3-dehydrase